MSAEESKLPKGAECIYDTPEWGAYVRHVGAQNIADDNDVSDGFDMFQAGFKAALETQQPEDATHKLRLRLGDVKNFALALLRGHEGDSIATDIANALLRLVGSSTQQAED